MYRQLSELVVRIADLAEAEGRVLRRVAGRLGLGLSLTLVAAVLLLAGAGLLLAALWLGLDGPLGHAGASAITGAAALVVAVGVLWFASRLSR